jgi:hypothetical protein
MVHAVILDVPAPVEMYDAVHAHLLEHATSIDGPILHLGRRRVQVIEVWESAEQCDRYYADVVGPILARLAEGRAVPASNRPLSTSTES